MTSTPADVPPLLLQPIGVVRSPLCTRVETPRQPRAAETIAGRIELLPGRNFEHALEDLAGWDYVWVLFWFHLNPAWRPKVLPPRSRSGRKGVFSTRAPHRPNPLGLSAVRLERVEGLTLFVSGLDMIDGTPVLDIKPYVPYTDAYPRARSGWLQDDARGDEPASAADPVAAYAVAYDPLALEQACWIEARTGLGLQERVTATLRLGPQPHPYRRIRREGPLLRLAVQAWRVVFEVAGRAVQVRRIESGYRPAELARAAPDDAERAPHREFVVRWAAPGPVARDDGPARS
jgi:tRNA-Thr(GGU) m(6)t(6)A37 methyltransferase TsaA